MCKEDNLPLDTDAEASCTSYPKKFEHNCNKCGRRISYHWTLMPKPVALHTPRSLNIIVTQVCKKGQLPLDTDAQASCMSYLMKFDQNSNTSV